MLVILVSQLEVYYKVDRLLTGITAIQTGTTVPWDSNKTALIVLAMHQKGKPKLPFVGFEKGH